MLKRFNFKDSSGFMLLRMAIGMMCILYLFLCWVWPVVEFMLYLFKDNPFSWWSIGIIPLVFILLLITIPKSK